MVVLHKSKAQLASRDVIYNDHAQLSNLYPLKFPGNFHKNGVFDIHWKCYWIAFLRGPTWSKQLPFSKTLVAWLKLTFNLNENSC